MDKKQFLTMSLSHGLVITFDKYENITDTMVGLELGTDGKWYCHYDEFGEVLIDDVKPNCRPLSDLIKPIEHKGDRFVPSDKLSMTDYDIESLLIHKENLHFDIVLKLISWHFNLMDEGEPFIDVNTLQTNPYK